MDELASRKYPVGEHMRFQRRMWVIERIGWLVLALIVVLALLGLFGSGVLSKSRVSAGSLTIDYARFERATRSTRFTFHFAASPNNQRRLRLNRPFLGDYEISSIQPPPARSSADGLDLTFAAPAGRAADVVIWAHPHSYGTMQLEARADDEPPLKFSVFVYP
jgi:hypothetical protein